MTKSDFISILWHSLSNIPEDQKDEILYDYEEHFAIGIAEGKSEEEICNHLGDPKAIAKQYRAESMIKAAEVNSSTGNIFRAVFAAVGLGFFNLIFVFGPFMGLVGILIGLYGASLGIVIGGAFSIIVSFLALFFPSITVGADPLFALLFSIGLTCLGLLFTIGNVYLTKFFYKVTVKYLNMNLSLIKR